MALKVMSFVYDVAGAAALNDATRRRLALCAVERVYQALTPLQALTLTSPAPPTKTRRESSAGSPGPAANRVAYEVGYSALYAHGAAASSGGSVQRPIITKL